jgi:hypothetical protein
MLVYYSCIFNQFIAFDGNWQYIYDSTECMRKVKHNKQSLAIEKNDVEIKRLAGEYMKLTKRSEVRKIMIRAINDVFPKKWWRRIFSWC